VDCFTTQVINSVVPFHLISRLKDKLAGRTPSWVVNVSSMEGVFYRSNKQHFHPHTNMAKAALNMLTRTSASDFKNHRIYMNAVDTGWVTNENPYHLAKKMTEVHHFKCPLDCLDGAMRVLDPIYQGLLNDEYPYGQFLKNYKSSNW
jgi:NAD(P)-dependent dehydrogenase (short-subunit alcohol dehydrogenase family)